MVAVMRFIPVLLLLYALSALADGDFATIGTGKTSLPFPVSNNAVTSVKASGKEYVLSFAGLGAGKTHADTLDVTLVFDSESREWRESAPLPGGVGRLAAVAASVGEQAYVFGGYTVAEDGAEASTHKGKIKTWVTLDAAAKWVRSLGVGSAHISLAHWQPGQREFPI